MAVPAITLVNQTASPIALDQLGVVVPASGSVAVTGVGSDVTRVSTLLDDLQLQAQIGGGSITVEIDGTALTSAQTQAKLTPLNPIDIQHNFSAVVDPTASDDENAGYSIGSRWINTSGNTTFICMDDSPGAAVWSLVALDAGDTSAYFEAYDAAGGTSIGGSLTDLPLDTQRISSPGYTHTPGSAVVEVGDTGTYMVYGHASTDVSGGSSRTVSAVALFADVGGGFNVVGGTTVWLYNRTNAAGANTGSFFAIMNLSAGTQLKLQGIRIAGTSTIVTAADGTGVSIVKIGIGAGVDAEQIQGRSVSPTAPTNNQVLVWNAGSSQWQPADQSGPAGDELVKVSANDTTAGFLNGKLVAGSNITLTEQNDGGNETLSVSATSAPPNCLEVASGTTVQTTATTPVLMTGMSITVPTAGTYLALFTTHTEITLAGWSVRVRIHVNGAFVTNTERYTQVGQANYGQVIATSRRLTLSAGDAVQIYWYTGGSGTASSINRALQLVRVTPI